MPRKPRIEFPGALYHVMSRGDRGELVYRDDRDRQRWLETLGEACEKTGWLVHAYVLMPNHYHLLLETPEANLVAGMKWLQGTYTQRLNVRHRLRGHLFQGRYKALTVEAEGEYFRIVSTYIHLNPARARLVKVRLGERLRSYRWSSFPEYLTRRRPNWLEVRSVLSATSSGKDDRAGRRRYEAYLESRAVEVEQKRGAGRALEEEWRTLRRGWYLGDETFRDRLLAAVGGLLKGRRRESLEGEEVRANRVQETEELLADALARLGWEPDKVVEGPKGSEQKQVLAWWLRTRSVASRRWIAERLQMGHETRVTWAVGEVQKSKRGPRARCRAQLEKR